MDKTTQDLVWSVLPKKFKEEVKKEYYHDDSNPFELALLENIFGIHNLTSDAEGEEMLTVSRKRVQDLYNYHKSRGHHLAGDSLIKLFGSKCLPDEHKECSNPSVVNCRHKHGDGSCSLDGMCYHKSPNPQEPKPAEPKLRRGSFAYHDNVKVRITKIKANGDVIAYTKDGYRLIGRECDFEPYTEPEDKKSGFLHGESVENLRIADEETHLRNLSQGTANCDKHFDNILQDSIAKERRLTIAAQIFPPREEFVNLHENCYHLYEI